MVKRPVRSRFLLLRRLLVGAVLAFLAARGAAAGPPENQTETYRGEVVGYADSPDGGITLEGEAYVISSHLGRGTQRSIGAFDESGVFWGYAWTEAANGDTLELLFRLDVEAQLDGDLTYYGSYELTGGTGRFVGASGQGAIFAGVISPDGAYTHRFSGQIFYPKPGRSGPP